MPRRTYDKPRTTASNNRSRVLPWTGSQTPNGGSAADVGGSPPRSSRQSGVVQGALAQDPISSLVLTLRNEIAMYRHRKDERMAGMLESVVDDIEAAIAASEKQPLTIAQASAVSGFTEDHLRREIRRKRLANVGRLGSPLVARGDLPRKQALVSLGPRTQIVAASRKQVARSLIKRGD